VNSGATEGLAVHDPLQLMNFVCVIKLFSGYFARFCYQQIIRGKQLYQNPLSFTFLWHGTCIIVSMGKEMTIIKAYD
jgi:hypothetical protein